MNPLTGEEADRWRESCRKCEKAKADYYGSHRFCPKCGGKSHTTTLVAYYMSPGQEDTFRDGNNIRCECGWSGTKHDMV